MRATRVDEENLKTGEIALNGVGTLDCLKTNLPKGHSTKRARLKVHVALDTDVVAATASARLDPVGLGKVSHADEAGLRRFGLRASMHLGGGRKSSRDNVEFVQIEPLDIFGNDQTGLNEGVDHLVVDVHFQADGAIDSDLRLLDELGRFLIKAEKLLVVGHRVLSGVDLRADLGKNP